MKDYSFIYNDLPVLKDGYTYYKLCELVDLNIIEDTSGFYFTLPVNEIKYIRPSHLSDDYRICDIDLDSIEKAPFFIDVVDQQSKCDEIKPSLTKASELVIYDTNNNKGGYAVFIDGHIKVGYIESKAQIPVSRQVAHFNTKVNSAANTKYILRELTSDYVLQQALQIQKLYNEVSRFDLFQLMIAVPSSEKQDEILKEEAFVSSQLNDVFSVINSYFEGPSKQASVNDLRNIFNAAIYGKAIDSRKEFNSLRTILENVYRAANKMGILHDRCIPNGKVNITESFYFMIGKPAKNCRAQCHQRHFPEPIEAGVRFINTVTNPLSHSEDHKQFLSYLDNMKTPYLLFSSAYMLCDIIIWFGKYAEAHPDVEKNKRLWINL